MNRDFFISLCFATHRVGNLLNTHIGTPIKLGANAVLSRLILLLEDSLGFTQKKAFAEDTLKELQFLEKHFELAKAQEGINPENFSILEREYAKIKQFAQGFVLVSPYVRPSEGRRETPRSGVSEEREGRLKEGEGPPARSDSESRRAGEAGPSAGEAGKSLRARKILGLLGSKEKVQVWELQKVMPQVTKRTLRRDLDVLVKEGALERKGQWNTVFYELKR